MSTVIQSGSLGVMQGVGVTGIRGITGYMGMRMRGTLPNEYLDVSTKNLNSLDGYTLTGLKHLRCEYNNLTTIPPSETIEILECYHNPLKSFKFSDFPKLKKLNIDLVDNNDILLNTDLFTIPKGIEINNDTNKTLEYLFRVMKMHLEWKDTFLKYQQLAYEPGGEKFNEAHDKITSLL